MFSRWQQIGWGMGESSQRYLTNLCESVEKVLMQELFKAAYNADSRNTMRLTDDLNWNGNFKDTFWGIFRSYDSNAGQMQFSARH